MKRILSIPAYMWAIMSALILPITFVGGDFFAKQLATLPFMKVHPIYAGGDSLKTVRHDSVYITINRPVFDGLLRESRTGFVQLKLDADGKLPHTVSTLVDYNGDGRNDLRLFVNTLSGETAIKPLSPEVLGLNVSSKVKDYWIVRVSLNNPSK